MVTSMFRIAAFLALLAPAPAFAAELVMFEQRHCEWCEVWDEEIGVVYAKTAEGARAPLRRVDIHEDRPDDLSDIRAGGFTPTFVVVDDGAEIGRITGYPGEDFFWPMLDQILDKLPAVN